MDDRTQAAIRSTDTEALRAKLKLMLSMEQPTQCQKQMSNAIIRELASRIVEEAL